MEAGRVSKSYNTEGGQADVYPAIMDRVEAGLGLVASASGRSGAAFAGTL